MEKEIDKHALLSLMKVPGVGFQRVKNLIDRFGDADSVFTASMRELVEVPGVDKAIAYRIKQKPDHSFADHQFREAERYEVRIVSYWDKEYPSRLKNIYDPPIVLFVSGDVKKNDEDGLAVVGTRRPSLYGQRMAERFARELGEQGITIVSGLARGIDTIAHKTVICNGGRTLAVLGSGIDKIYPAENKKLSRQIVESGALISEFPMNTTPEAPHFPRRNRIIAGLSKGIFVIEAAIKSGALITANQALEQGRDIFALPGQIDHTGSAGCNLLIQQGAKLVQNIDDILGELGYEKVKVTEPVSASEPLSGTEEKILSLISDEPSHVDQIAVRSGMSTSRVMGILLALELKNAVKQIAGKRFVRY